MEARMNKVELMGNELDMVNGGKSLASKIGKWLYNKLFSEEKQQVYDPCNTCPEPVRVEDMLTDDVVVTEGNLEEILMAL